MGICPKDGKPCIDDVCYGAGCLRSNFYEEILSECSHCGSLGSDSEPCECEYEDYDDGYYDEDLHELGSKDQDE